MKTIKLSAVILFLIAIGVLLPSCWLFDEEEIKDCGPKKNVFVALANSSKPVDIGNFQTQDGTYSYYWFEFPPEITLPELCIEEHCQLRCTVSFKDNLNQNLKGMKIEGMIEIGFTGHPMIFTKNANNTAFDSDNDFGLKQAFSNQSYGWIYGRVNISFETYGTSQEEIDILNQVLQYINVDFDYYERKQ